MTGAPKLAQSQPWHLDLDAPSGRSESIDARCIGIARKLAPDRALHLASTTGLTHVVQREGHAFETELASAERLVVSPESFREFPLCTILTPDRFGPQAERASIIADCTFTTSLDKNAALGQIVGAAELRFAHSITEDVRSIADELFTNAIYNAPFVDFKSGVNPGVSRTSQEIRYAEGMNGRLVLAADKSRLVLGCVDPFGNLNLPRFLHRVKETYVRGPAATMNFGPGGAGLGSYIIYNTGCSLYLGVWERQATAIFCVIPLGMGQRKRSELPKHLHWIQR